MENLQKKELRQKIDSPNGITLIALIITVILMLILASVALSAIGVGGLFDKTQNAADLYKGKAQDEKTLLESLINSVEKYASKVNTPENDWKGIEIDSFDMTFQSVREEAAEEGEEIKKVIDFNFDATITINEGEVSHCELYINDELVETYTEYSFSEIENQGYFSDTPSIDYDGTTNEYNCHIVVYDTSENSVESESVTVQLPLSVGQFNVTYNYSYFDFDTYIGYMYFNWDVVITNPGPGVERCELFFNDQLLGSYSADEWWFDDDSNMFYGNETIEGDQPENLEFYVIVYDIDGNFVQSDTVTISTDKTAPTVEDFDVNVYRNPRSGYIEFTYSAQVSDDSEIDFICLYVNDIHVATSYAEPDSLNATLNGDSKIYNGRTYYDELMAADKYECYIVAYDKALNSETSETVTIDVSPVTVSLYEETVIYINWSILEVEDCAYYDLYINNEKEDRYQNSSTDGIMTGITYIEDYDLDEVNVHFVLYDSEDNEIETTEIYNITGFR